MHMTEQIVIHIRVRLMIIQHILFQIDKQLFVGQTTRLPLFTAMAAPVVSKRNCPSRMDCRECFLADFIPEQAAKKPKRRRKFPDPVAMSHEERLAVNLLCETSVDNLYTQFFRKIVKNPDVMIPDEPHNPHPGIRKFREFSEEPHKPPRHHIPIFIPIVQHIS